MAVRKIIFAFILAVSINIILSDENTGTDEDYEIEKNARVVGRAYSLTGCDYGTQAGYTCMACNRALHCYIGGVALIVDCYGLFRFCSDGRCGRRQGDKCFGDKYKPEYNNTNTQIYQQYPQTEYIPQPINPPNVINNIPNSQNDPNQGIETNLEPSSGSNVIDSSNVRIHGVRPFRRRHAESAPVENT